MLFKIKLFFSIPALIVHELGHLLAIILCGAKSEGIDITVNKYSFECSVNYNTSKNWKTKIISIAPIFTMLTYLISIFNFNLVLQITLLIYFILFYKIFWLSKEDIERFNKNNTEYMTDEEFETYFENLDK